MAESATAEKPSAEQASVSAGFSGPPGVNPHSSTHLASIVARLAGLPDDERRAILSSEFDAAELEQLEYCWPLWARQDQLAPPGAWRCWLLLGGRGSGKTRSAAEWIRAEVESCRRARLALISPTADTLRRDVIEGASGLLAISPRWNRPQHEPSTRRLVWPNGAIAHCFSAEEPDRLRGPNLDAAWFDEIAACPLAEAVMDNLQMALRLPGPKGDAPRLVVSTTPRPLPLLRRLYADPSTVVTKSRTVDNSANLDAATLTYLRGRYAGTSLGRQELDAEILDAAEGALWTREMLDHTRVTAAPDLRRIVIAVDPAGGSSRGSDETGIIAVGRALDGSAYVLADLSGRFSPDRWARRVAEAFVTYRADAIVAERNYGGDMVESTIRSVMRYARVKMVTATRGKAVRAEPIVALYEQGKIHHVGLLPGLEDQLCTWEPLRSTHSPDRLDALVWALTELMVTTTPSAIVTPLWL